MFYLIFLMGSLGKRIVVAENSIQQSFVRLEVFKLLFFLPEKTVVNMVIIVIIL